MSLNLFTAPAGAGKTQHVIEQIRARCEHNPLPRVLVIVPASAQLVALRERLPRATFGVTLTEFHSLYRDILDAAGELPRLMPDAARYRVMRHVIRTCALAHFAPIAEKPGFIASVSTFIADLKARAIFPDDFARATKSPRARDLAAIYSAYQNFLREHALADREGMGWLARQALEDDATLYADFDYVAADGFDQFNPTQIAILDLLARRVPQLDIPLTFQPNRLAHSRFDKTLAKFPNVRRADIASTAPRRADALDHLERNLFEPNAPRVPANDAIAIIAAPDRTREVRAIARVVKRLLIDGTRPAQIVILFRQLDAYQAIAREVFTEFSIPFRVRSPMPLESNPQIAALVNLLRLSANDFPWRDTLDVLRAPYFAHRDLAAAEVAHIEQIARAALVVRGRAAWRGAFTHAAIFQDEEEDERAELLGEDATRVLGIKLATLFARMTPAERVTARAFAEFIEGIIGPDPRSEDWLRANHPSDLKTDATSLRVIECARAGDPDLAARDVAALESFYDALRGLVEASELLNEGELAWNDFLADLVDAISAATYDLNPTTEGRVVIAAVTQMRGVPKGFVFLGGLVESEFPARAPEDPLLTATERDTLREQGVPLEDLRARDETTLFYEAVTLARRRLWLAYPYLDDDANPLYPSPYLDSVTRLFDSLPETRIAPIAAPAIQDAASYSELAVALTHAPNDFIARALANESRAWNHSLFAREIEARREASQFDEYSGVFRDASLRAEMARRFDAKYSWSASQFNDWGACGFRFFARRVLDLKEIAEPEEGLDALMLGTLYHEILEAMYRQLAARQIAVTDATLADAQAMLRATAGPIFDDAVARGAFRPTAWWEQERAEMVRRLDALLSTEAERNASNAPIPFAFEIPFGFDGKPALKIVLPIGAIRVRGKIDRMDRMANGVVLIDYKTGSTPIGAREVIEGRNVQMPIYVMAAEQMGQRVANAFFFHIRNAETSGELSRWADRADFLARAREHIERFVSAARAGAFAVAPTRFENGACKNACEFASLCRVGRWNAGKAPISL